MAVTWEKKNQMWGGHRHFFTAKLTHLQELWQSHCLAWATVPCAEERARRKRGSPFLLFRGCLGINSSEETQPCMLRSNLETIKVIVVCLIHLIVCFLGWHTGHTVVMWLIWLMVIGCDLWRECHWYTAYNSHIDHYLGSLILSITKDD